MKFSTPDGLRDNPEITADYENAEHCEKLRVGNLGVYFRNGFLIKFIPYEYIDRAFIRIHEVDGKLCCGSTVFQYFRLVLVHGGKEFTDFISENEKALDATLAAIAAKSPNTVIGFES